MDTQFRNTDRNMLPRLREAATAASLGELDSATASSPVLVPEHDEQLENRVRDWKEHPEISFAADLVSSAFVLGQYQQAREAAEFLASEKTASSDSAKEIAARILDSLTDKGRPDAESKVIHLSDDKLHRKVIRSSRERLANDPRNAIAWTDLARGYLNVGVLDKAKEAMQRARLLAPTNRFVLRSATRLLVHCADIEQARDILIRSEGVKVDPWILAAEIATSSLAERPSRNIRLAKQLLSSGDFSPFHICELASALATIEVHAGNGKAARKLFALALKNPTENSVAQAEWATTRMGDFRIGQHLLKIPYSHEANARYASNSEAWDLALGESWNWQYDEPFSTQPALFGSFIAADMLERYSEAERLARQGLLANRNDPALLNNLAFALAHQGKVSDALSAISHLRPSDKLDPTSICLLATRGLIAYRSGDPARGRTNYLEAIEGARQLRREDLLARATVYLACEELRANSPGVEAVLRDAVASAAQVAKTSIRQPLRRLKSALEAKGGAGAALSPFVERLTKFLLEKQS